MERTVEKLVESNYKYMEGKTMDPINNNQGKILDSEDLTNNTECEIKESYIISNVPEHEAS